ncbi:MAG: mechanosensitive ion channel protein MscS, partial [Cyanobacteria bacterium P01_H01_bin.121]
MRSLFQNLARGIGSVLDSPLFHVGKTSISLGLILQVLLLLSAIILLFRIFKDVLKNYLLAKLGIDEGNREA